MVNSKIGPITALESVMIVFVSERAGGDKAINPAAIIRKALKFFMELSGIYHTGWRITRR